MSLDPRVDLLIRDDYALFERLKPYAIKWEWFDLPAFAPRGTLVFETPRALLGALIIATNPTLYRKSSVVELFDQAEKPQP